MAFCVFCGQALPQTPAAEPLLTGEVRLCPKCGKADSFNTRFCVFCGSDTALAPGARSGGQAAVERPGLRRPTRATKAQMMTSSERAEGKKQIAPRWSIIAAIAGLCVGMVAAYLGMNSGLELLAIKNSWPHRGLIVYATPSMAQVYLEEQSGQVFTIGQTGPDGALSLPDVPPGTYRLTLSAPGRKELETEIRVELDRVTVIGFPKRIDLPLAG